MAVAESKGELKHLTFIRKGGRLEHKVFYFNNPLNRSIDTFKARYMKEGKFFAPANITANLTREVHNATRFWLAANFDEDTVLLFNGNHAYSNMRNNIYRLLEGLELSGNVQYLLMCIYAYMMGWNPSNEDFLEGAG